MNSANDGTRTLIQSVMHPEVLRALQDWGMNFKGDGVLIGDLALSYYVKPRMTQDIDVLFLSEDEIPATVQGFNRLSPGEFRHNKTRVEVKVFTPATINADHASARQVFATAKSLPGMTMRIASADGLVALKLVRATMQVRADIDALLRVSKINLYRFPLGEESLAVFEAIAREIG